MAIENGAQEDNSKKSLNYIQDIVGKLREENATLRNRVAELEAMIKKCASFVAGETRPAPFKGISL